MARSLKKKRSVTRHRRGIPPDGGIRILRPDERVELIRGAVSRIASIKLAWLFPSNAFFPVTISWTTAPKVKGSVRTSASFPSSCSG